jgi:hypothetical protein
MSPTYVSTPETEILPEAIVPAKFSSASRGPAEGERRLLLALLEQALACYRKHASATDPRGRRAFAEAEAWLMGEESGALCSFQAVCDFLGLDPDYIRTALAQRRQTQMAVSTHRHAA